MTGGGFKERISTVAEVDTVNAIRDGSGDREVMFDRLFGDGSEVAGDLDTWVGGFREWVAELVRKHGGFRHVEGD